jgi:hypothetical protein
MQLQSSRLLLVVQTFTVLPGHWRVVEISSLVIEPNRSKRIGEPFFD